MFADTCSNIHEDDILNTEAFPLRPEDLEELEAVEDWVEMLASMDELEENEEDLRAVIARQTALESPAPPFLTQKILSYRRSGAAGLQTSCAL